MSYMTIPGQFNTLLFAEESDRGVRSEVNRDSILHVRIAMGDLLLVADGLSDQREGAAASRMVAENFYAHLSSLPEDFSAEIAIREAAARANSSILEAARKADSAELQKGSAVVVALVQQQDAGTFAWVGHIGDSRAYLVRGGRLHRLTTDHSAAQDMLKRGLIDPEDAQNVPEATMLARSLGQRPEVEIDIEQHPLGEGDTLLLCSFGLWGYVHELDIQETLLAPVITLETAAHNLLELALAAGGQANIGIELARMIPPVADAGEPEKSSPAAKWIFAGLILAVVILGVLAYFAFWG